MNSGRRGRPFTVDDCLIIDLPFLMRLGWIRHGQIGSGSLNWRNQDKSVSSIRYHFDLADPRRAELCLHFEWALLGEPLHPVEQRIPLVLTGANYGGIRWWMLCPMTGQRATKLYRPPGQEMFAGRHLWRLGYRSQRVSRRDRSFDKLYQIQAKLGAEGSWETMLFRPKGMWHRTFNRYLAEYQPLQDVCEREVQRLELLMGVR